MILQAWLTSLSRAGSISENLEGYAWVILYVAPSCPKDMQCPYELEFFFCTERKVFVTFVNNVISSLSHNINSL
jgi:hypothetical protein